MRYYSAKFSSCEMVMFPQASVNLFTGEDRVSLVPGPFQVPDPMSFWASGIQGVGKGIFGYRVSRG